MRFAEEGRHQGEKQECYKPWRIDDEACGKACHRHQVLRLAQHLPHQRHPPAGLAAGPFELVLELGVFKIFQVQRCRVLHQADAGGIGHPFRKQAVDERDDTAQNIGRDGKREFSEKKQAQPIQQPAVPPRPERFGLARRLHQHHHIVDDQLAHEERCHRKQRPDEAQHERCRGEARARPPHHRHEGPQVFKGANPFPEGSRTRRGGPLRRPPKAPAVALPPLSYCRGIQNTPVPG